MSELKTLIPSVVYLEGLHDAEDCEPLYEDADPEYARGWCAFHNVENPYTSVCEATND